MLSEKMYVRCPADIENNVDPRIFICGQIIKVDDFKKTLMVKIHDPFDYLLFFDHLPHGIIEIPIDAVNHCSMFIGSEVIYENDICKVVSSQIAKDGYYYYFVQKMSNKTLFRICEKEIIASFTNGKVDPTVQLRRYEFQNPAWFIGHSVVSRSMNILENSIYGFKELAGSKIYLLPHQINSIMRCLQETPCRYMLADEVGMGKTIIAISVLKIFLQNRCDANVLIVVPETLKEQWISELLLKFNISIGIGENNNKIIIRTVSELTSIETTNKWDYVVVDEVHRYLDAKKDYSKLHSISLLTDNILLLSATPVQQREEEYLDLLKLLEPEKYKLYDLKKFSILIGKQSRIIQKTSLILDDLGDFEDEIGNTIDINENPHDNEDCIELYEEIHDELEEVCKELNDPKLNLILDKINFEDKDLGVYQIKVIISYICSNYQIESNIIRNRRKLLQNNDDGEHLLPTRKLATITYRLDEDKNVYEALCYKLISDLLTSNIGNINIQNIARPLLGSFFSSPWAFMSQINLLANNGFKFDTSLINNVVNWLRFEQNILENISAILDDPYTHEEAYSTRLISIMDHLSEELFDKKIILFTNYPDTFKVYQSALKKVFDLNEISFFGESMTSSDIEINAYRFQNDESCRIMLCDYTGGEGRNFQCADYIIHIDLPWDANMIEQRIGRLDRLGRDKSRPIVHSIVIHTEDTFEAALFDFWNKGLKIFTQSLGGMEIIMKDINQEIISAIQNDFEYGLFERIPRIIELADTMRETVRKEQNYDAAGLMFRPMYAELKRLIDYYAENENTLFANSMTNWANLAGFRGFGNNEGIITYTADSFSQKSAINSQLIPPYWNEYLNTKQNKFITDVQDAYNKSKSIKIQDRSIRGTFIRKLAIENDYLHFFAPGDEIFECIVNNAINSCKGKSSAFAASTNIGWRGLIFTWSLEPNDSYLLDNGVSIYALSPYRNYLMSEQVVIPISIENKESHSDEQIIREYSHIINSEISNNKTIHLGKRSHSAGFLRDIITKPNITWFKEQYTEEKWIETISLARKTSYDKAFVQFKNRSNIRGAREEMDRTLSARVSNSTFYGINDNKLDALKLEQAFILEAIQRPKITLDSVAFVWMVKKTNG